MEAEKYNHIVINVRQLLGIDLRSYKDQQMQRRLDSWLLRSGSENWEGYFKALRNNSNELSRFRDYLTINVSEFFRDSDRWQVLEKDFLPRMNREILSNPNRRNGLRIWSAGCSIGAEPYSLAILLDEIAPGQDHSIIASDLDQGILRKARNRGPYSLNDVRNVTAPRLKKYFDQIDSCYYFKEKYAQWVKFKEHDLLQSPFEKSFDLIVCRNVIIYFTSEAKLLLYKKFYDSLRFGGVLFLGGTEIIPRTQDFGFTNQKISFYIK